MPRKYKCKIAKKGLSTAEKASKALTLVNKLKNTSEVKYDTYAQTQSSNWNGAQFSLLDDIAQGTGQGNRIGDEIRVKDVTMRMQFRPQGSGALKFPVRIVMWRDYEGVSTITPSNMFVGGVGNSLAAIKMFNPKYQHDYKILYDRTFTPSGTMEYPAYKIKIPIDATVKFDSSGAGEPIKNAIRCVILSGADPATAADLTAIDLLWLLRYTDL